MHVYFSFATSESNPTTVDIGYSLVFYGTSPLLIFKGKSSTNMLHRYVTLPGGNGH